MLKLPDDNVYTIQMGDETFKLTGASLNSDAPNYFTDYFITTDSIFIDRNVPVFHLIAKHLQGYFLDIRDESEYAMLLADSIYYRFKGLTTNIKESPYYYANIGGRSFKFLKKLFRRDGDSNNFFQIFSNTINSEIEHRFINNKLAVVPITPNFVSRSPELFQDLLDMLNGATLHITQERRESLIKETIYYRFLNLEQRLLNTHITINPFNELKEIVINLNDVNAKGITSPLSISTMGIIQSNSCMDNVTSCKEQKNTNDTNCENDGSSSSSGGDDQPKLKKRKTEKQAPWNMVRYQRPFVDETSNELIFQLDANESTIIFNKNSKIIHIDILGDTLRTFDKTFSGFLNRQGINLDNYRHTFASNKGGKQTDHLMLPACISISDLQINGVQCRNICKLISDSKLNDQVIDLSNNDKETYSPGLKVYLSKSLWKFGIKNSKLMLIAIKLESFSGIKEYNKLVEFI